MPSSSFVHLHLHTQYSLLDGAITIDSLCERARAEGMPAVAMTDHGNLYGAIEFYQKAVQAGVKPIIGCEVYIQSHGSRFDKVIRKGFEPYHHLTLLAMNREGYQNLCHLSSLAHLEGFYYKPRIDKEVLKQYGSGLIVLSGCLSAEMAEAAQEGGIARAQAVAEEFRQLFGDRFFLEIQSNDLPQQIRYNEILKELSGRLSIPLVATNDCHYLQRTDAAAHEALLCVQTGKTLEDPDRMRFLSDAFYFRTAEEMRNHFRDLPQAIDQTLEIANRCDLSLDLKSYHFPKFDPPEGKGLDEYLEERTWQGFAERWKVISRKLPDGGDATPYRERLKQELSMIHQTGFAGYFLIVADFINFAKSQKIPVGPGRGSATGSLVAYCLNITDLDPLPYNLLFERFLNPERISMPDMDIDFCMDRRDEVIHYVQKKYGNVAQIITFGKMKARAVVRDVGRVLTLPYGEVDRIAKLIPNGINMTLEEALRLEPRLKEASELDPRIGKLITIARSLEGLNRHASTHAAGVVISDRPLVEFLPLTRGQNGEIVTQFDMKSVEEVGLIKFDFLGLKTLTVIDRALKIIQRTKGKEIVMAAIPLDDPQVYQQLASGETAGIFQLESAGMRDLIVKLSPTCFEDLIALVALYRPGPLGSGMVEDFINRKHGKVAVRYEIPELQPILKETYGVIVYQEQVMQIASRLANFSLGDADILRRAMGKKKAEEMAEQHDKFITGCRQNKIPIRKAERTFDLMAKFAEYGFNKSHSAAYAFISYQTAYLKRYFPVESMASLLTHEMGNTDKVMAYIAESRAMGISILPPDINESFTDFSVVGDREIRFGLAAVKNVGTAAVESILEARRREGRYRSFIHFCSSVDGRKVNRRVLEGLIKCGAFDSLGIRRSQATAVLDEALEKASSLQRDRASGQRGLFGSLEADVQSFPVPEIPEWEPRERLQREKESLGFYITGHPLAEFEAELQKTTSDCRQVQELEDGKEVLLGGVVAALRELMTRANERMAFVTLEDLKGTVQVIVFSDLYRKSLTLLQGDQPILVRGRADVGEDVVKVIAQEIHPLRRQEGRGDAQEVHFHLPTHVTRQDLHRLKELLARHRGSLPAFIHLKESVQGETILTLPDDLKVTPSEELITEVDSLFGYPVTTLH